MGELLLLLFAVSAVGMWQTRRHISGAAVPAMALRTLEGGQVSLESLRGKPTLLAFWAPWCGVCRFEAANLRWLHGLVGERANVISVATAFRRVEDVKQFRDEHAMPSPVLLDDGSLAERFAVDSFPTLYFLDSEGRVKRSVTGYTTTAGMLARLVMPALF